MTKRYTLLRPGASEDSIDWLEEIETWSQRTRHRLEWLIGRSEDGLYTAQIKINGELVPLASTETNPRRARINLVKQVDRSEPAILTI
ncbi:hypothetical protein OPQ81_009281 [Rhizoctonia solani]|nr:hypothetical protein OPQ81_009281 [Rhizoctonia solani]